MKKTIYKNLYIAAILALAPTVVSAQVSVDLELCRKMALENSELLRSARNEVSMADLDIKIADAGWLPKIDGSASAAYMVPDMDMMGSKMQVRGAWMAGLQLVQPIFTGGKITAGKRLARIGKKVADEQMSVTRADILMDVDNAYWTYVAVLDKVKLMESYHAMMDTLFLQTSTAVEAGMAVGNDLLRISAKKSEIEYQRRKAVNGADLCRMALCNAIGIDPDTELIVNDSIPQATEPGQLIASISDRPEYHLLKLQEEAARQKVKMTRADFLPSAGLSIGYNYYGNIRMKGVADLGNGMYMPYTQKFSDGIGMGMLSVNIPLFHWGEGIRKVKKAKIEVENALLETNRVSELLDLEARRAATNLSDGWGLIESAGIALAQANENLRVMQNRYEESVSTLTDLLDAQTQWQQAKSNLIEARTQYQIYLTAWKKASGNL